MLKVIKREPTRFRIQIYDLKEKRSRNISLTNHEDLSIEDLKQRIIESLEAPEKDLKKGKT